MPKRVRKGTNLARKVVAIERGEGRKKAAGKTACEAYGNSFVSGSARARPHCRKTRAKRRVGNMTANEIEQRAHFSHQKHRGQIPRGENF